MPGDFANCRSIAVPSYKFGDQFSEYWPGYARPRLSEKALKQPFRVLLVKNDATFVQNYAAQVILGSNRGMQIIGRQSCAFLMRDSNAISFIRTSVGLGL